MPVRVELVTDARNDLEDLVASGNIRRFLKKLVYLEEHGKDAGLPLGNRLTGLRKIVVGDRNWRIVFMMNSDDTVATVWVIGDREDDTCYQDAARRLQAAGNTRPEVVGFASVVLGIMEQRAAKKTRKKKSK